MILLTLHLPTEYEGDPYWIRWLEDRVPEIRPKLDGSVYAKGVDIGRPDSAELKILADQIEEVIQPWHCRVGETRVETREGHMENTIVHMWLARLYVCGQCSLAHPDSGDYLCAACRDNHE